MVLDIETLRWVRDQLYSSARGVRQGATVLREEAGAGVIGPIDDKVMEERVRSLVFEAVVRDRVAQEFGTIVMALEPKLEVPK